MALGTPEAAGNTVAAYGGVRPSATSVSGRSEKVVLLKPFD